MCNSDILPKLCQKSGVSYIVFDQNFKIIDFDKNIIDVVECQDSLVINNDIRDTFWELTGIEEQLITVLEQQKGSITIPMVLKKNHYYDIDIELCDDTVSSKTLIAYVIKKSEFAINYLNTIREVNKKTLVFEQNQEKEESHQNYYNLINKKLLSFHVNREGIITKVNVVCCFFLGIEKSEIIGRHFSQFFYSRELIIEGSQSKILNCVSQNGEDIFFHADVVPITNDENVIFENIIICQDITYLKRIEKELEYASQYDCLTSLANRTLLFKKIDEAIDNYKNKSEKFALCFIDLNDFKPVNDTYGHHAGDMLLKHIGQVLSSIVREQDTLARIGGDEFVILLSDIKDKTYLSAVIKRLKELPQQQPLLYNEDNVITFDYSLGLSIYPENGSSATELLDFADKEMYRNKKDKRLRNPTPQKL